MPSYVVALLLHGLMAGVDVILNHELLERLPGRAASVEEELLHSLREFVFFLLFAGIAWFSWNGVFAWIIAILLFAEVVISTRDVIVEGDTRVLPVTERVLHLYLFINLGVIIVLLGEVLIVWAALPSALVPVKTTWWSFALSALAVAALGWSIRDAIAAWKLRNIRSCQ